MEIYTERTIPRAAKTDAKIIGKTKHSSAKNSKDINTKHIYLKPAKRYIKIAVMMACLQNTAAPAGLASSRLTAVV
jgi:hypothetical protein